MSALRPLAALALTAVLTVAGCATAGNVRDPFQDSVSDEEILLTVENNDFRDATIHVYWGGVKSRAGRVLGKTSETFRLRWRHDWARLGIDFLGGGGYQSEELPVDPGDHLNFVIMIGF